MQDEATLFASVLIHSYALGEAAAAEHLSVDPCTCCGIEDWGQRLLQAVDRDWSSVAGGLGVIFACNSRLTSRRTYVN
jgi:hypothetical protein